MSHSTSLWTLVALLSVVAPARAEMTDPALASAWAALDAPVQACFDTSNAATPGMSGSVTLSLTVAADGHVPAASILADDLGDPDASLCMMIAAHGARFPASVAGQASLTHTWTFSAPTATTANALVPTAGTLRDVLMLGMKEASRCYADARARQPGLVGGLVLNLHVDQSGATGPVEVASSTLGSVAMEDCVEASFRSLVFPPMGEDRLLLIPMAFPVT